MKELTRHPDKDPHLKDGWFVYYGDVRVGHIGRRAGVPTHAAQWGWTCGFNPGCDPGQATHGTGDSFEDARDGFEKAWTKLVATRTEAHFELWRQNRDWHAWKDQMMEKGLPLPTQRADGRSRCFCGTEITSTSMAKHVQSLHRGLGA
jgi:hypothetical protein